MRGGLSMNNLREPACNCLFQSLKFRHQLGSFDVCVAAASCELFHFVVLVIVLMSPSGAAACLPVAAQGDIYEPG